MNAILRGLHPGIQFLLFLAMTLTFMGIGAVTAMGIGMVVFGIPLEEMPAVLSNPTPEYTSALMWMNNATQLFTFLIPVLAFMVMFGKKSINGLLLRKGGMLLFLSPVLMFLANGIFDLSSKLNMALIPENSWMEKMFKPSEDLAARLTEMMLNVDSPFSLGVAVLSIALIPAICEELAFRGVAQPLLAKMTKNVHAAIWISAALFSLIHVQFYGFLPRLLMGALLGYMVIWSGSIWASILAHFVNNAMAIFLYKQYGSMETPADASMNQWYAYLTSGILFLMLLIFFLRNSKWPWLSFEYLGITKESNIGFESNIQKG